MTLSTCFLEIKLGLFFLKSCFTKWWTDMIEGKDVGRLTGLVYLQCHQLAANCDGEQMYCVIQWLTELIYVDRLYWESAKCIMTDNYQLTCQILKMAWYQWQWWRLSVCSLPRCFFCIWRPNQITSTPETAHRLHFKVLHAPRNLTSVN